MSGKRYFHIQDVLSITEWQDDHNYADGWRDPPFKGFRIVLYDMYFAPLQVKSFPAGHTENLSYAYLTPDKEVNIINYLRYFEYSEDVVKMIHHELS